MIDRYSSTQMRHVWSDANRYAKMTQVELAVVDILAEDGVIPERDAATIADYAIAAPEAIKEREKLLKHETAAFVAVLGESAGEPGKRWIHHGLTSSDVVDTASALQVREAGELVLHAASELIASLLRLAGEHAAAPAMARTHGRNAQVTTFGYRVIGWWSEIARSAERLSAALDEMRVGKLSGPVGTHPVISAAQERRALARLRLLPEVYATQIVSRDRYASMLTAMAVLAGSVERVAENVRLLSQSGIDEVSEGRAVSQQGSSAMPHKVNPIRSERIVGLSRLLRSYAFAILQDQALWSERDLTHSSVERIVLPDSFALLEFALNECTDVMNSLQVDLDRMQATAMDTEAQTGLLLNALVGLGFARQFAHAALQGAAQRHRSNEGSLVECLITELNEPADGETANALRGAIDLGMEVQRISAAVGRSVE